VTRYWVVGLIVAFVALLFAMRRIARRPQAGDEQSTLVPHGDGERELVELDPMLGAPRDGALTRDDFDDQTDIDDTAPAVLSPPEWTPPKSAANGSRR
jgi:hypothetical protein